MLVLAGAGAEFVLASDLEGVLERAMSLALVQADVGPALSVRGPSIARSTGTFPLVYDPDPYRNRPDLLLRGIALSYFANTTTNSVELLAWTTHILIWF